MAKSTKGSNDDVMKDARDRFSDSNEGSDFNRLAYHEDFKFARLEDQWPDQILAQREQEGRPHLVINKLPSLIRSVVNESRQNKPAIKVSPVDNGADEETAEVIGGIIRSIERSSSASVAYNSALEQAVTGGFGFFRVGIDYAHDETFDMECTIDRIPNALQVNYDTSSVEFDASDWEFAFISDMLSEREFKHRYPDAAPVDFESAGDESDITEWVEADSVRVAEYFLKTPIKRKLVMIEVPNQQSGKMEQMTVREEHLPAMAKRFFEAGGMTPTGGTDEELAKAYLQAAERSVIQEREVDSFKVTRRIINGVEVLEEEEWPGTNIPICPVWGEEIFLDGRRYFRSMIRSAKDSQMMFNFWRCASTELVALAPKAPWVGPQGFVPKGHEDKWNSANTRSHSYLEYVNDGKSPPPSRQSFAGVPAGALQEAMNSNDDMKSITGIFDSSIGAQSNETSGKAILARERQGDVSNFHFIDNLSRAIRYCGEILVEVIPSVYSARETIRILGEDQAQNVINLTQEAGGAFQKGIDGKPELYNLTVGKYDVEVSTGPSFATEREETRETLIEIMRQVPDAAPFIGDVLLDHMDFVGADKVAKRLKSLLPQPIRDAEADDVAGSDNPEAAELQQQLKAKDAEMQQAQQAVMAEIEKMQKENDALKADKTAEMQRLKLDAETKDRELGLKEAEAIAKANEPPVDETIKYKAEMAMKLQDQDFEADQNEKDRQVDLAKTILAQGGNDTDGDIEAQEDPMTAMGEAMCEAARMMNMPKRIVRDEMGQAVGVESYEPEYPGDGDEAGEGHMN
jgi:hypothetical protein